MVNSIEVNYEDVGHGETLVLLHGLGSTIKDWDFQIPVLSEKFRLIIPDFRGHGKSGINNDDFGVEFLTEDIFQLLHKLEIDKAYTENPEASADYCRIINKKNWII